MHSIRNAIEGKIKKIISDKVMSEIILDTPVGEVVSVITTGSAKALKLRRGSLVVAQFKATNVSLSNCDCGKH
jgi:molybdopterin-binding protein